MNKIDWILLIAISYLILVCISGTFQIINSGETKFCQENGFEESEYKNDEYFCVKKFVEGNEISFERTPIYCEKGLFAMFYFQRTIGDCYFLKEVDKNV